MKVYILIEENSPELARECGGYNIIAVYKNYKEACAAALKQAESHSAVDDYEIVDRFDERSKGEQIGYTLYLNGNEDSDCWFNVVVEPMALPEQI